MVLFLALCMAVPSFGVAAERDGFDKVRPAPGVEFLDGTAIDLLIGVREDPRQGREPSVGGAVPTADLFAGEALSDLLVDVGSGFDLDLIPWISPEEEGHPSGPLAGSPDDLETLEAILALEETELPSAPPTEPRKGASQAQDEPSGKP